MAVDSRFTESLLRNLKIEEPWLPPKPWESIPSESGGLVSLSSSHNPSHDCIYDLSSVSEASLARLVMNALQGVQSAVVSIEHLSAAFCADPADRSRHRIPTLWNRSLSTCALGKILKSIGFSGSLVILLHKFVEYFTYASFDGSLMEKGPAELELETAGDHVHDGKNIEHPPYSLVNQAFGVAVRKVLEGYMCALDTLTASAQLRRFSNNVNTMSNDSLGRGSLTTISHAEVTLVEIYLHTKELRTRIEGLGHLCCLYDSAACFSQIPFEDLVAKGVKEFHNFPKGGNLLTYLYKQLQVVDPAHCTLLKFLFLQSLEPYCRFIRSWIYEAKISDPYGEFIIEYGANAPPFSHGKAGIPVDFSLATVREQDGIAIPCFLKTVLVPLLRAGQQLQVVMKLLRLFNYVHSGEGSFEDILPSSSNSGSDKVPGLQLSFNKGEIDAMVVSRKNFYCKMHEKLENFMDSLDIKYHQVILHDAASVYARCSGGAADVQYSSTLDEILAEDRDLNQAPHHMDSEASSVDSDYSYRLSPLDSSECSSTDGSDEQVDSAESDEFRDSLICSKPNYLSSLCFSSLSSDKALQEASQVEPPFSLHNDLIDPDTSCREPVELSRSWISEIQYAGHVPNLGWPVGGLHRNPVSFDQRYRDDRSLQNSSSDQDISKPSGGIMEESISGCSNQLTCESTLMHEVSQGLEYQASNSYLIQSWNAKYPCNVLSMNPMLTTNAFIHDAKKSGENTSEMSKRFPHFDFSYTIDPLKIFEGRLPFDQRLHVGRELYPSSDSGFSAGYNVDGCGRAQSEDDIPLDKEHLDEGITSMNIKSDKIDACLKNACGGSSWQGLLHGFFSIDTATIRERDRGSEVNFEIPLDFIIDKCLLQEILLQYIYVSRLSIKLLEGGFELQAHFHALRRYHFMDVADWADLFITSLWHHKWYITEADQKIPAIQGLLESSIQRSSCESDPNKDRLYVFVKDHDRAPFAKAAVGLHSFDFIGLGYRVDWPVSIVLTPSALRIYAEIFTFLIQVKLAALSLADVWSSLKGFRRLISQGSEQHQLARRNFNYLVKLRHQVNHFVSTLQQYVLSQLSDVSWYRFRYSLEHEVKDMMDLESVHMAYLTDSLRICFLSDETRSISNNIEGILQCALDFRSCLVKGIRDVGTDKQDSVDGISIMNISLAHSVKENFDKNLRELHISSLKSPKHEEFGLPRFWSYLNYNEYYSDTFGNQMCHYNLFVR